MKSQIPFGVVLIREGDEAGQPAKFHRVGTLAHIEDFDQLQDGNLGLSCRGGVKFEVKSYKIQSDNLIVADVEEMAINGSNSLQKDQDSFAFVARFVQATIEREEWAEYRKRSEQLWQDPEWISYQAAELLPLSPDSRQLFLEMSIEERLSELGQVLQEANIV